MELNETILKVQPDFNKVISYSQGLNTIDFYSDKILSDWYNAKKRFIDAMGGELIKEFPEPISFTLSEEAKLKKVKEFQSLVLDTYNNIPLHQFIFRQSAGFFRNAVVEKDTTPDGKIIPVGMKLLKAFKFFESDEKILNELQSKASQIIQENKIEGILCVSVHPLDFLSSSENLCNWRSCHALDGEYRSGNLSYMCDETTVICYLKTKTTEDVRLPAFPPTVPWNSKKWRMLLYINTSENCMFAGRQYPFFSDNALSLVRQFVIPTLDLPLSWSSWHQDKMTSFKYENGDDNDYSCCRNSVICIDNKFHILERFVKDESKLHYNDLLHSTVYTPYYCWTTDPWEYNNVMKIFKIGSKCICPVCGETEVENSDLMTCYECHERYCEGNEDIYYCECCDRSIHIDFESIHRAISRYGDSLIVCNSCVDRLCDRCEDCGELIFRDEAYYHRESESYLCIHCFNRAMLREGRQEEPVETPPSPSADLPAWIVEEEVETPPVINISTNARGTTFTASNSVWDSELINRFFAGTPAETPTRGTF